MGEGGTGTQEQKPGFQDLEVALAVGSSDRGAAPLHVALGDVSRVVGHSDQRSGLWGAGSSSMTPAAETAYLFSGEVAYVLSAETACMLLVEAACMLCAEAAYVVSPETACMLSAETGCMLSAEAACRL